MQTRERVICEVLFFYFLFLNLVFTAICQTIAHPKAIAAVGEAGSLIASAWISGLFSVMAILRVPDPSEGKVKGVEANRWWCLPGEWVSPHVVLRFGFCYCTLVSSPSMYGN